MARLLSQQLLKGVTNFRTLPITRNVHALCKSLREFEEIEIKVPWGHVAAKWYGPRTKKPLIGWHGWLNNAGTFDTLAPLLPHDISFLSLDLPGHGLSSRMPDGCNLHSIDYLSLLLRIMKYFDWETISLLGHSMSSINSFVFSSLYPEKVDVLIGLDMVFHIVQPEKILSRFKTSLENSVVADLRNQTTDEPPLYSFNELVERIHEGSEKSINREMCHYILARNIKQSLKHPDKFYFSHDGRLKHIIFNYFNKTDILRMAKSITAPTCLIKANQSTFYDDPKYAAEVVDFFKKREHFDYHQVDGSHHVHLNEPQKIAPIINAFLHKYYR